MDGRIDGEGDMTQDERWMVRYNEVKGFIETNHRNPSKYVPEEKLMVHFLKRGKNLDLGCSKNFCCCVKSINILISINEIF